MTRQRSRPTAGTELAEDLSIALLLTLDRLSPLERAAFLLHDVFDFSFSEVATALERSEAACRQLAARARAHVRAARPRGATAPPARPGEIDTKHAQLLSAFVSAIQSGDLQALTQLNCCLPPPSSWDPERPHTLQFSRPPSVFTH